MKDFLKDQVVIATGAGGGLGKHFAIYCASLGAKVVAVDPDVNNLNKTVSEIKNNSSSTAVVSCSSSIEDGQKIIDTAIKEFGAVHIIFLSAQYLPDLSSSFDSISDKEWALSNSVNVNGPFALVKAVWPHFRKQKYGRIVAFTGLTAFFGAEKFANFTSQKLGIVSFTRSVAKEGQKYNILANTICPIFDSERTAEQKIVPLTVDILLNPEFSTSSNEDPVSGHTIVVSPSYCGLIRTQRAKGAVLKVGPSLTPGAILKKWDQVQNFKEPQYAVNNGEVDFIEMLEESNKFPDNDRGNPMDFREKVVVITGAGGGLGRSHALLFAKLGASVVVNDIVNPDEVVKEITSQGGKAVGDRNDVCKGDAVIKTAIDNYGRIDILINNAGVLRDKSLNSMTKADWDLVQAVHVNGTFACTKAAWPYFKKQKYGRIVNTTSGSGLYGNFGQTNYACAKMQILGLTLSLAIEGEKDNIKVNAIAPVAGTNMTKTVMPEDIVQAIKPDHVSPLVALLSHEYIPCNGQCFEAAAGWFARVRYQINKGQRLNNGDKPSWDRITSSDEQTDPTPENVKDAFDYVMKGTSTTNLATTKKSSELDLSDFKTEKGYEFTERDVILYNLGVGAKRTDLRWVYENDLDFQAIPSFAIVPYYGGLASTDFGKVLPNFDFKNLLHGEHYISIKTHPLPTSGKLRSVSTLLERLDKGRDAILRSHTTTYDDQNRELFVNIGSYFVKQAGGFGGPRQGKDYGFATRNFEVPKDRKPDFEATEMTFAEQAALFRLSGDYNPLHIDPNLKTPFGKPILHGLCFMGIAVKHLCIQYGSNLKEVKVRFSGHVFPGETLVIEMWKEAQNPDIVIFQAKTKERGTVVLSSAAARFESKQKAANKTITNNTSQDISEEGFMVGDFFKKFKAQIDSMSKDKIEKATKSKQGVYRMDVTNSSKKQQTWVMKATSDSIQVTKGANNDDKPDCTIIIDDALLLDIVQGKQNAQTTFMRGKYKIKGNIMKSQKMTQIVEAIK